jgi:hypothetical protein
MANVHAAGRLGCRPGIPARVAWDAKIETLVGRRHWCVTTDEIVRITQRLGDACRFTYLWLCGRFAYQTITDSSRTPSSEVLVLASRLGHPLGACCLTNGRECQGDPRGGATSLRSSLCGNPSCCTVHVHVRTLWPPNRMPGPHGQLLPAQVVAFPRGGREHQRGVIDGGDLVPASP